jgi:hypothetical protein
MGGRRGGGGKGESGVFNLGRLKTFSHNSCPATTTRARNTT